MYRCVACSSTSWLELAEGNFRDINKRFRMITETHEELRGSFCRICQMLALIKPPDLDHKECWLSAISSTVIAYGSSSLTSEWKDCTYLTIRLEDYKEDFRQCGRRQYLALVKDDNNDYVGTIKILPNVINFDYIHESIQACCQNHKCCKDTGDVDIPGLHVIDCLTNTIVSASAGCEYVALSYVWGEVEKPGCWNSGLDFPPVVQDSVKVTLAIGQRFLWVDRFVSHHTRSKFTSRVLYHSLCWTFTEAS